MSKKFKKYHTLSVSKFPKDKAFQIRQICTYGLFGIRILRSLDITQKQLLQYKALITKILKTDNKLKDSYLKGCFYNNIPTPSTLKLAFYPYVPRTEKSQGSRMGKGKGAVVDYYWPAAAGSILFEISTKDAVLAQRCVAALQPKIGVPVRLVSVLY